jgi:hypothetical protein
MTKPGRMKKRRTQICPEFPHIRVRFGRIDRRTVGEVVEKVALWINFRRGFQDHEGIRTTMTGSKAAKKVGEKKNFFLQYHRVILACRQLGYDFNQRKDENAGDMFRFVKDKTPKKMPLENESAVLH